MIPWRWGGVVLLCSILCTQVNGGVTYTAVGPDHVSVLVHRRFTKHNDQGDDCDFPVTWDALNRQTGMDEVHLVFVKGYYDHRWLQWRNSSRFERPHPKGASVNARQVDRTAWNRWVRSASGLFSSTLNHLVWDDPSGPQQVQHRVYSAAFVSAVGSNRTLARLPSETICTEVLAPVLRWLQDSSSAAHSQDAGYQAISEPSLFGSAYLAVHITYARTPTGAEAEVGVHAVFDHRHPGSTGLGSWVDRVHFHRPAPVVVGARDVALIHSRVSKRMTPTQMLLLLTGLPDRPLRYEDLWPSMARPLFQAARVWVDGQRVQCPVMYCMANEFSRPVPMSCAPTAQHGCVIDVYEDQLFAVRVTGGSEVRVEVDCTLFLLNAESYPADVSRGVEVPGGILHIPSYHLRLPTRDTPLLLLPFPDRSMRFNVFAISLTVCAFVLASVWMTLFHDRRGYQDMAARKLRSSVLKAST